MKTTVLSFLIVSFFGCSATIQEPQNVFSAESLTQCMLEDVNSQEWSLDTLFVHFDDQQEKALLIAKLMNSENHKKSVGLEFEIEADGGYLISAGVKHTCTGENCANCDFTGNFDIGCKCVKKAHPQGGPSYCNHSLSSGISQKGWKITNYESLLDEINSTIK